jgi:hypothetical protein
MTQEKRAMDALPARWSEDEEGDYRCTGGDVIFYPSTRPEELEAIAADMRWRQKQAERAQVVEVTTEMVDAACEAIRDKRLHELMKGAPETDYQRAVLHDAIRAALRARVER